MKFDLVVAIFPNLVANDYKSHVVVNGLVTIWLISTSECKGYVQPLQKLSVESQIFKEVDIIIIDEMSMMTSTLLQSVETRLQQIENDTNEPYHSKLVILVGDHAQLLIIWHCHLLDTKNYCQKHYVYNAIDWNFIMYHTLETSIRHVEESRILFFF